MGWYEDGKTVFEYIQKSDNVELIQKMMALQKDSLDLHQENQNLKEEINNLREKFKFVGKLVFMDNAYWEDGVLAKENGPYCPGCWDSKKENCRLVRVNAIIHKSPVCRTDIRISRVYG